ncbi:MAG: radical SAM protein [Caldisericum exile]|uniref:Radical SAM protein n=1 Tax=Caldisericum exile TaxID=693075 RepID=A0A2J6WFD7_9BACT|nr:MAG: radical SAM protein [Caldisericum exile]PMP68340.1 MAG: radical SAM protein [Caldisericum exile]
MTGSKNYIQFISFENKLEGNEELAYRYIYGPITSRRLGVSLGVTTVPHKVCSFNCIYCEVGKTTLLTTERKEYIPAEAILEELKDFLSKNTTKIDHITFSGLGEPTLHIRLGYIIKEIKKMTNISIAVLSNGSLITRDDVKMDLLNADIVKFTLNATDQETYEKISLNHPDIKVQDVISGIVEFRKMFTHELWIEILLVKGINNTIQNYLNLYNALSMIKPDKIHINTVIRAPAYKVEPLSFAELLEASRIINHGSKIIYKKGTTRVAPQTEISTSSLNSNI